MSSWVFQGNPKNYKIDKRLRETKTVFWLVNQKEYIDEIQRGDEVYIWRSDYDKPGTGGIVAKGVIISLPKVMQDDKPEYWQDDMKDNSNPALRVRIAIEDVRLSPQDGMLLKTELKRYTLVGKMRIFTMWRHTNYPISENIAQQLRYLWTMADPHIKRELDEG